MNETILEEKNLQTSFSTESGPVNAVDGVSFTVQKGRTLGVVGESGCGKSVTSLSIMRLIPNPPGEIVGGEIIYKGRDLLKLSLPEMRKLRGNEISMIFQEPMTSLNPVFTIGNQIMETLRLHQGLSRKEAHAKAIDLLRLVNIPSAETRVDEFPHQLSGGMRQRVMIAMALACKPNLLICDEPTTALDVTIQAQILELMRKLRNDLGMAMILITHDLGVVAETADDVAVMYAGRIVEQGAVAEIFARPKHPYTQGLLGSIPKLNTAGGKKQRLMAIPGMVPSLADLPKGCRFQDRCPHVFDRCRAESPPLRAVPGDTTGHTVSCWKDL
jgi:oligopeptide/dipeptide ABC transporter ATP-binding protein